VRQLKTLALCLLAACAVSALVAASASAKKPIVNPDTSPHIFKNCPLWAEKLPEYEGHEAYYPHEANLGCVVGATEGGQYTVGGITVPLANQILIQYGVYFAKGRWLEEWKEEPEVCGSPEICPADWELLELYVAPVNKGVKGIKPTKELVPGEPIAHITVQQQEELGWPEALKASYAKGQKKKTVKTVYETIEQAGPLFTSRKQIVSEGERQAEPLKFGGAGVVAPVMIKGENKWMSKELGDTCYIGSEAEPITQYLTSGKSVSPLSEEELAEKGLKKELHGATGKLEFLDEGGEVYLTGSDLVDNTYAVPGAECTGPYSEYIQAAIDKIFGIPSPAGANVTELTGTLYDTTPSVAKKGGAKNTQP
jgi:hypothetical protein